MQFKTPYDFKDLPKFHDLDTANEMPAMPKSNYSNVNWHDGPPKPSYPYWPDLTPRNGIEEICKLWFGRMVRVAATLYVLVVICMLLYKVLMMVWAMK